MASNWARKVFVAATPISRPARVKSTPSASRVAWEPTMFVTASTLAPARRAKRMAASVSAVSPDWLMATHKVLGPTTGSRYRNSEATSISTGMRAQRSIAYLPTKPA